MPSRDMQQDIIKWSMRITMLGAIVGLPTYLLFGNWVGGGVVCLITAILAILVPTIHPVTWPAILWVVLLIATIYTVKKDCKYLW